MRQKLIIMPKLNRCGNNPEKQWFVYYSCRNPKNGKMERFRHYDGFTGLNLPDKIIHGHKIIEHYATMLRTGWTPFADAGEVIYNDHLDYKSVADLYGTQRKGNNTLRVWISKFLEEQQRNVSLATYQTYQSKFRIFMLWCQKQKVADNDLTSFNNKLICEFFIYLIDTRKLSKISLQKYDQNLTALFEYIKTNKLILINPVFNVPKCDRINDQAPRPIQRADIDIFKKELIKDPELWLAVQLEFYCALRPGHEIRLMKIKDIDFISGTIRVDRRRAKTRIERIVTMPHQVLTQMRQFYGLNKYDKELFVFGRGGMPGTMPIGKNKLRYKFAAVRKKLNMPLEYKFYSWKHTGAVEADNGMIPFKDISLHLGHSSLKATDYYFRNKKTKTSEAIRDHYPSL